MPAARAGATPAPRSSTRSCRLGEAGARDLLPRPEVGGGSHARPRTDADVVADAAEGAQLGFGADLYPRAKPHIPAQERAGADPDPAHVEERALRSGRYEMREALHAVAEHHAIADLHQTAIGDAHRRHPVDA